MAVPFNTGLLDEAIAQRQQRCEQERQQTLHQASDWLRKSGHQYGIYQAYIFGSVIQPGQFHDNSDVDVGVNVIDPVKQIEAMADLSMAILRDVDIVDLRRCYFADRIREQGRL